MVNWKKKTTLLEEKNLFSLLRVYEQVVFLSRLHNRQVWSCPGIPPFPPPTLPKAEVLLLKLHIGQKVRNIELWPIPCVMKYWRFDLSFKKKKNHHPPPPTSVSIPKKLSIISWSSIRSKEKVLLSNCIRSLDYLCVNRLRQHISWWGGKFLLRRWSKILWWQRPVVLPTVQWRRWAKLSKKQQ